MLIRKKMRNANERNRTDQPEGRTGRSRVISGLMNDDQRPEVLPDKLNYLDIHTYIYHINHKKILNDHDTKITRI